MNTIKIKPNLCQERKSLLASAIDFVDKYAEEMINPPDFVFANVHGNIMLKMAKRSKRGMFFEVKSITHLALLVQNAQVLHKVELKKDDEHVNLDFNYS